jgi:hypothetical protein
MRTEQEIREEIRKTTGRVEALEHLIAEAELGIKMHRKEIDVVSARLRGLQWCLEKTVCDEHCHQLVPEDPEFEEDPKRKAKKLLQCLSGYKFGVDCEEHDECDTCDVWEACDKKEYLKKRYKVCTSPDGRKGLFTNEEE